MTPTPTSFQLNIAMRSLLAKTSLTVGVIVALVVLAMSLMSNRQAHRLVTAAMQDHGGIIIEQTATRAAEPTRFRKPEDLAPILTDTLASNPDILRHVVVFDAEGAVLAQAGPRQIHPPIRATSRRFPHR